MKHFAIVVLGLAAGVCAAQTEGPAPLVLVQTVPLEGVQGRIDHMCVGPESDRLFVAALGNNTVEVIDLKAGKRSGTIKGLQEPQGLAVVADSHALVVASAADGMCRVYDRSLKLTGTLADLDDADNVRYDAGNKYVWVGYGSGGLAVIDPAGPVKKRETKLDGHPESFQLEQQGSRLFVNVPTAQQIAVIDSESGDILARWPVTEAKANFPMALDEKNHRLFVGCRKPATLLVFNTEAGKLAASVGCCGDTDDVFYDAARKRIYVSGGEGTITVLEQVDADQYRSLATIPTASGARTSCFDAAASCLYVAVPHRDRQAAEIRVYKAQP